MDTLTDATLAYLKAQIAAGAQVVQVFDSWVGALAPRDYERSVLPSMRRLFDGLQSTGVPTIHFGTGTAGLLPLMASAGGDVIGIVNSARIGASFVGPVAATSILAWGSPATVYLVLAVLGIACVPVLRLRGPQSRARPISAGGPE